MSKISTLPLALTALVCALAIGVSASGAAAREGNSEKSEYGDVASSKEAAKAKKQAMMKQQEMLRRKQMMARQAQAQRQSGMGMPSLPVDLPGMGGGKLDLKSLKSSLKSMLEEDDD